MDRRGLAVRSGIAKLGAVASLLTASLLLVGCANVFDSAQPDGSGVGGPGSSPYEHPTGAQDVLVSISGADGAGPQDAVSEYTTDFLLLGDGTGIVPGVVDLIYPGPAIYPLQSATLGEDQIQEFLSAAEEAGLLGEMVDFGLPALTDVNTTNVTINVNGQSYRQSAYALSAAEESALSNPQKQARAALTGFIETARGLVGADSESYVPTAVIAFGPSPSFSTPDDEAGLEQQPQLWPIASVPRMPVTSNSGLGTCLEVTGAEVPTLLAALANANALTPWVIDGQAPTLIDFRPLLPGDPGCKG